MVMKNQDLIKKWEQLRLEAYLPTPDDVWTIGWGHTHTTKPGMKITKEEAQKLFESDLAWVYKAVDELVKVPLNQNQKDALYSFVFNIGKTNFAKSTLLKRLNAGLYEEAAAQFPRWNKQGKKVLRGLVRRRAEEMAYFLLPVDKEKVIPTNTGTVTPPEDFKSILKSKEAITGITAVLTGVGAIIAGLTPVAQVVIVGALAASLVVFGGIILVNRLRARAKGIR